MSPPRRRTTALRVLLTIAFVWLTASYVMGAAFLVPAMLMGAEPGPNALAGWLVTFPMIGGLFGAPFLFMAGIAWLMLHRAGRATAWMATASGAGVGLVVALSLLAFFRAAIEPIVTALISGPILGWLAWRIAYGGPQPQALERTAEAFN